MSTAEPRPHDKMMQRIAIAGCAGLLILFAILSYTASLTKSATYDEPLHAVAGFVHRTMGDFRINAEDPALFGYWASLAHRKDALKINTDYRTWDQMLEDFSTYQWPFVMLTLYHTPGNDGDTFIQQSRFMFVIVGMALGAIIAWWAWQLGGAWAAVIAAALFALDPNFLAHSALVKNDVMLSFMMIALAIALYRFGRRGTPLSLAAIALTAAAAVNVKFSGVLCGPIIFLALLIRALLPQSWVMVGRDLNTRLKRLAVVPIVCLLVGIVTYAGTWACYGFRFTPTSDPKLTLDDAHTADLARINKVKIRFVNRKDYDPAEYQQALETQKPGLIPDVIVWASSKRLLPQSWLHGFLYTYATTLIRSSFLMGEVRLTGWWYYFPAAMLFKTPTATLGAVVLCCLGVPVVMILRRRAQIRARAGTKRTPGGPNLDALWPTACIAVPVIIYAASAMSTNLNLGLRHILPVYPFIFVALGVGMASIIRWERTVGGIIAGLVLLGLAIETGRAYPDFIAFFNTPSGGSLGGIKLLGDSNLDWGQDLKLLSRWQEQHKDKPLFLAYFGIADPAWYGIEAIHVPFPLGGWPFAPSPQVPAPPCYLAVSATNLQGIYIKTDTYADIFRNVEPTDILGGTIYIYEFPPRRMRSSAAP
jgi:hypothetical protein